VANQLELLRMSLGCLKLLLLPDWRQFGLAVDPLERLVGNCKKLRENSQKKTREQVVSGFRLAWLSLG